MKETGLNESIMTLPPEMTIISDKENASDESILINELVAAEKPSTQRISKVFFDNHKSKNFIQILFFFIGNRVYKNQHPKVYSTNLRLFKEA